MSCDDLKWKERIALNIALRYPIRMIYFLLRIPLRFLGKIYENLSWITAWLKFLPREDDIYIVTYPRSGTTLMQMILYQLNSDGKMDFAHISEKVPYFERALRNLSIDLNVIEGRRIFKTHQRRAVMHWWPGKYIYIVRNGPDVLLSYFHFYRSHFDFRGSLDDFYRLFIQGKVAFGSWFHHVNSWSKCANDPNVLYLKYEEITTHLEAVLPQIAKFCGVNLTPSICSRVLKCSSFEFMKEHEEQFDFITEFLLEKNIRKGEFIRKGVIGASLEHLSKEQLKFFEVVALDPTRH